MPGTSWAALITAFATMALLSCACADRETPSRPEKALATIASPGEAAERATPAAPRGPALVFVAFDSDGSKVVVWNLETWQPIRTVEFRVTDEPTAVALAGDMILYAFLDRVEVEPLEGGSRTPLWHAGADQAVTTIAVSPDGELVAIGVEGRDISDLSRARLVIVRLSDGAVIREFGREAVEVVGAAPAPKIWTPDGSSVVFFGYAHRDAFPTYGVATVDGGLRPLKGALLAFSPDGAVVADAEQILPLCQGLTLAARTIHLRELASWRVLSSIEAQEEAYFPLAVGPAGEAVLLAGRVWDEGQESCVRYPPQPEYRHWDGHALLPIDDPLPILRRWEGLPLDLRMDCPVDGDERPDPRHFACWSTTAPGELFADGRSLGQYRAVEIVGVTRTER